jgi:hypothetical protein
MTKEMEDVSDEKSDVENIVFEQKEKQVHFITTRAIFSLRESLICCSFIYF